MNLNVEKMKLDDIKGIVIMLVRNLNYEHGRLTALQDRVLELEMKNNETSKVETNKINDNDPRLDKIEKDYVLTTLSDIKVDTGANCKITIDKAYGTLCASSVRVFLEYTEDLSDWVVEHYNVKTDQWDEKARWDCQIGFNFYDNLS